jgi:hypothetical protein
MSDAEKLDMFWKKGCAPRCYIYMVHDKHPITPNQFIEDYEKYFVDKEADGLLNLAGYIQVIQDFGLKEIGDVTNYGDVEHAFNQGLLVHVASDIELMPLNSLKASRHGTVLTAIDANRFSLWSPYQDGTDGVIRFDAKYWLLKQCRGLIYRAAV